MPQNERTSGTTGVDGHATNGSTGSAVASAQAFIEQGNAAAATGDFDSAEEAFEQAVAAEPSNARARYDLALARQNLGDPEGAIASYMRAIQLDPNLIEAYINLGNLYSELGMEEEALDAFQHALELDSGNDELFINLGDAYRGLGYFEDAILAYRQAQILNPDNTLASDNLRDVRERLNQQAEDIADLEKRVDEDPRDLSRYSALVDAYLEAHREQDALNIVNQMIALAPDDPNTYVTQAQVFENDGSRGRGDRRLAARGRALARRRRGLGASRHLA